MNCGNVSLRRTAAIIVKSKADIIVLQEITGPAERFIKKWVSNTYPYMYFKPDRWAGGFGFISKTKLTDIAFVKAKHGPFGFLVGKTSINGKDISLVNLHLTPAFPQKNAGLLGLIHLFQKVEAKHLNEIKHVFNESGSSGITLFMGDLNSASFMAAPQFLKNNGFIDSFASVHEKPDSHHTWKWKINNREVRYRIDYIFHPSHVKTVESSILRTDSSDHDLVVSTLQFDKAVSREEYVSSSLKKKFPYLSIIPDGEAKGIFMYMHGAGGGMEQGISDSLFKGSFKRLKQILKDKKYIYVCPSTVDYEKEGSINLNELCVHLLKKHGDLPIVLAGASAGARTALYTVQDQESKFAGLILICPAVNQKIYNQKPLYKLPIWIVHGKSDSIIPYPIIQKIASDLKAKEYAVTFKTVSGGHDAPVELVQWKEALTFIGEN
ncbi:endonuclease/exonuclease/phosphatase family protein [Planctomycetota bacterium]